MSWAGQSGWSVGLVSRVSLLGQSGWSVRSIGSIRSSCLLGQSGQVGQGQRLKIRYTFYLIMRCPCDLFLGEVSFGRGLYSDKDFALLKKYVDESLAGTGIHFPTGDDIN